MKWTFPIGTPQRVLDRMRELGVPIFCADDQEWELWKSHVQKFMAGGLWITRDCPYGTQTHEVR